MVLWYKAEQSPQGTIPLFCETKQKATVKGAVWQKGEFLQTPRAHLGLSPCLLSLWAREVAPLNTNVTIGCLNATKVHLEMRRK